MNVISHKIRGVKYIEVHRRMGWGGHISIDGVVMHGFIKEFGIQLYGRTFRSPRANQYFPHK